MNVEKFGSCIEGPTIYKDEQGDLFIYGVCELPGGKRCVMRLYQQDNASHTTIFSYEKCCQKARELGGECLGIQQNRDEACELVVSLKKGEKQ